MNTTDTPLRCSLFRRLLAISYDCLLLTAILFVATAALLPFTGGNAIHSGNYLYLLYLIAWAYFYFGFQWTHGGQTLGMRAWKIQVQTIGSIKLDWIIASKRFLLAMLSWLLIGIGFLWALFDTDSQTFHDRFSGSGLFRV